MRRPLSALEILKRAHLAPIVLDVEKNGERCTMTIPARHREREWLVAGFTLDLLDGATILIGRKEDA